MDKKAQMYIGGAVVLAGAYILWNKYKKKSTTAPKTAQFAGKAETNVVGERKRMVGMIDSNAKSKDSKFSYRFSGSNENVKSSNWLRADATSIAPRFFDVKNSKWGR